MKKSFLIIACSIALFSAAPISAQTQDNDKIMNMFSQTADYMNKNPQKVNEMIKQLEANPELKNYAQRSGNLDLKNVEI